MKSITWFVLIYVLLTACTASATTPPSTSTIISTSTATFVVKTSTPTQFEPTPTEKIVKPSPTPSAEPTPTSIPTSTWLDYSGGAGEDYLPEQIELITSGALSEQEEQLNDWEIWWGQATNRPFRLETTHLQKVPFFPRDDPENAEKTIVVWQAMGEDYQGKMFYFPIDIETGKCMDNPPETLIETIPEGFGPLEISGGDERLELANAGGELVMIDSETGFAIQRINLEIGQWEDIFIKNWEIGLIDGLSQPASSRVKLHDHAPFEEGKATIFGLHPTYAHKIILIDQISPEIQEITFGFNLNGEQHTYTVLYTRCEMKRPDGSIAPFGQTKQDLGELSGPQVIGLESITADNPDWASEVFVGPDGEAAREVCGGLVPNSQLKTEIKNFWGKGDVPANWTRTPYGPWDLREYVALTR